MLIPFFVQSGCTAHPVLIALLQLGFHQLRCRYGTVRAHCQGRLRHVSDGTSHAVVGIQRQSCHRNIHLRSHIVIIVSGQIFGVIAHRHAQHSTVAAGRTHRLCVLTGAHHRIPIAVHCNGTAGKQVGILGLAVIVGGKLFHLVRRLTCEKIAKGICLFCPAFFQR